jgi:hypothetical protein
MCTVYVCTTCHVPRSSGGSISVIIPEAEINFHTVTLHCSKSVTTRRVDVTLSCHVSCSHTRSVKDKEVDIPGERRYFSLCRAPL